MSTFAPPRPPPQPYRSPPPPPPARTWKSRLPWRSPEAKAAPRDDPATLCLSLVTLVVGLSLGRLFRGSEWIPYGLAAAGLGHFMAWGLRRLGAGLTTASLASALLSILVAVELVVPEATTFGVPTPFTFQVLGQALTQAQTSFRSAVPPVVPQDGFVAAAVVGVCMCAFLADWAAFRMRTAYEACIPGLALFVFASVLAAKSHRGIAVAGFAAATLVFLIVQRANLEGGQTAWFGGRDRGALRSLLGTGAVLGAVAVVGALVLSPMVPGATSKAVVSFKKSGSGGSGSGNRSTVSPLVDIQTRLRQYANVDVFTVKADQPAYWRLTSLDQFDGSIWSSNERYGANRGQLTPRRELKGTELRQQITIRQLSSIWLPSAYQATAVDGVKDLSYSPGSASLITKKDTSDGLAYTITSVLPDVSREELRQAPRSQAGTSDLGSELDRYLEVGGRVSPRVRQLALRLGATNSTPYDKAFAIQQHLRSKDFTYSLEAQAGHSGSAIDQFLFSTKTGYCEQFAGSYAVLARLMGLPTRVAVGFQPGARQNGTFSVLDKDAHAWPEVYFEGKGWIAFEPTPSAGNPQATDYTGVQYEPAAPRPPDPTTPTTAPASATPTTQTPGSTVPPRRDEAEEPPPDLTGARDLGHRIGAFVRRTILFWLAVTTSAAVVGGSAWFVAWERGRRRRRHAGSPEDRVHMAWEESIQALALAGVRLRPAETVAELLHRLSWPAGGAALAGVERGTAAHDALLRLGHAVIEAAYTGRQAPPAMADAAEADRALIVEACRSSLSRWSRFRSAIDPRPAWDRLRSERPPAAPRPADT